MHHQLPSPLGTLLNPLAKVSRQVVSTGFSISVANWMEVLILHATVTLATGTITMPPAPRNGQTLLVSCNQIVSALTVNASGGQTIYNAPTNLNLGKNTPGDISGFGFAYVYEQASASWYRYV